MSIIMTSEITTKFWKEGNWFSCHHLGFESSSRMDVESYNIDMARLQLDWVFFGYALLPQNHLCSGFILSLINSMQYPLITCTLSKAFSFKHSDVGIAPVPSATSYSSVGPSIFGRLGLWVIEIILSGFWSKLLDSGWEHCWSEEGHYGQNGLLRRLETQAKPNLTAQETIPNHPNSITNPW